MCILGGGVTIRVLHMCRWSSYSEAVGFPQIFPVPRGHPGAGRGRQDVRPHSTSRSGPGLSGCQVSALWRALNCPYSYLYTQPFLDHKLQTLGPRTSQRMLHFPCAFHRLILSSTFKVAQESKHCTPLCGPCLVQPPRPPTHSLLMGLPASTPAPNRSPTGQTENCLKH